MFKLHVPRETEVHLLNGYFVQKLIKCYTNFLCEGKINNEQIRSVDNSIK